MDIPGTTDSNDSSSQVAFLSSSNGARASPSHGFTKEDKQKPFSSLAKPQDLSDISIESVRKQLKER